MKRSTWHVVLWIPMLSWGQCITTGGSTTCSASNPNPYTVTVGTGSNDANHSVILQSGVGPTTAPQIITGDAHAVTLGDLASITLNNYSTIQNTAVSAQSSIDYQEGLSTVVWRDNGQLSVAQNASIVQHGTVNTAHAVAVYGRDATINNHGLIQSSGGSAIYFEHSPVGFHSLDNFQGGIIRSMSGAPAIQQDQDPLILHQWAGAMIDGDIVLGGISDTSLHALTFESGAIFNGNVLMASNVVLPNSELILNSNSIGNDILPSDLQVAIITKNGPGIWNLLGDLGTDIEGLNINVTGGTLSLSGILHSPSLSVAAVTSGAVLEAKMDSLPGDLDILGTLRFPVQPSSVYNGVISGLGAIEQNSTSTITLLGNNTFTGTTYVQSGTIQIGDGSTRGALPGPVVLSPNTQLQFNRSDISPGPSQISGTGTVMQKGTGTTILTGNHAYTGTTFVNAGVLQLGNGVLDGILSSPVTINNNGTLKINNNFNDIECSHLQSGTGHMVKTGTAMFGITNMNNTFSGDMDVQMGTLSIQNPNAVQSMSMINFSGGALRLDRAMIFESNLNFANNTTWTILNDSVFRAVLSGAGELRKEGVGTLLFQGSHTQNPLTVNEGIFQIGANINDTPQWRGATTVNSNGLLGGFGRIIGNVTNHGNLLVGTAVTNTASHTGPFTIEGNLTNTGRIKLDGTTIDRADGYNVFNVLGNYQGDALSNLLIRAHFAENDLYAGMMHVTGNANGASSIRVIPDIGSTGTHTGDHGLLLVQVDGQSNAIFTLSQPLTVDSYQYDLRRGSGLDDPDNWYLYSNSTLPIEPQPLNDAVDDAHNWSALYAQQHYVQWLQVPNMHQRLQANHRGIWLRAPLQWLRLGNVEGRWAALEGGAETTIAHAQHPVTLGMMINRGWLNADNGHMQAYTLTAYTTLHPQSKLYVDMLGQYSWANNTMNSTLQTLKYDTSAWTGSMELGYTASFKGADVIPQLQLGYLTQNTDDIALPSSGPDHTVLSRIGIQVLPHANHVVKPWVNGDWWHYTENMQWSVAQRMTTLPSDRYALSTGCDIQAGRTLLRLSLEGQTGHDYRAINGTMAWMLR
jgi:outer membrane autotransporter protein